MSLNVSKKVKVLRKKDQSQYRLMLAASNTESPSTKRKIGAAHSANGQLKGLTYEEEKVYLSRLLGIDSGNIVEWNKVTNAFWDNISYNVDGENGLELEIGFSYLDEVTKKTAQDMEDNTVIEKRGFSKKVFIKDDESDKYKLVLAGKANPINTEEYVLWRYLLVYSRCANRTDWINNSPNIEFFIYDETEEVTKKAQAAKQIAQASVVYLALLGKEETAKAVIRMFNASEFNEKHFEQYPILNHLNQDIDFLESAVVNLLLSTIKDVFPSKLVQVSEDPDLNLKATIEAYISYGVLRRPFNSNSIMYGDLMLGENLVETVGKFKSTSTEITKLLNELSVKYKEIKNNKKRVKEINSL